MNKEIVAQRAYWNNEADAFQKIYTHRKSRLSNTLDKVFRKDMYERFAFTIANCEPIKDRTFLDVGCGNGLYSIELAKRGAAEVMGIDIAEVMVDLSRNAAKSAGSDTKCSFLQTDLLNFEPDRKFDVSFGIGLFDYISDPAPVLRKMREVTKDRVIVAFPRFWTWRAPIRKVRLSLRGCAVYFYTKARVISLMKAAGFETVKVSRVGKLHCVVAE
ncbi:MAG: class I SAM-dependent methyltransferase [Pyrinomonadaceae bacterium]